MCHDPITEADIEQRLGSRISSRGIVLWLELQRYGFSGRGEAITSLSRHRWHMIPWEITSRI